MNQEYMNRDIEKASQILEAKFIKTENYKNIFTKKYMLSDNVLVTTTWKLSNHDVTSLIFASENTWNATSVLESPDEAIHKIKMKGTTIISDSKGNVLK